MQVVPSCLQGGRRYAFHAGLSLHIYAALDEYGATPVFSLRIRERIYRIF